MARQLPAFAREIGPELPYCSRNWRDHALMPRGWPAEVRKGLYETFISRRNASFPYRHVDYWSGAAAARSAAAQSRPHLGQPEVPLRAASPSAIRRHVQPALARRLIAAVAADS